MPGVPSSRGCDACRKQKKKCVSIHPPCPRCLRLGIICENPGQQRFKFISVYGQPENPRPVAQLPSQTLSSDLVKLRRSFIHVVHPEAKMGFNLPFNFGDFLLDVPCRLGTNPALDAAASALVTSYMHFCRGSCQRNRNVLLKHGCALMSLRSCLNDSCVAQSPETLCAIQLVMIYQAFLDSNSRFSHSRGVTQILKGKGFVSTRSDFEEKILLAQRASVVVEGIIYDDISFSQQEWTKLVENKLDQSSVDGRMLHSLARAAYIIQRWHQHRTNEREDFDLARLAQESCTLRDGYQPIVAVMRSRLQMTDAELRSGREERMDGLPKLQALLIRTYCFSLSTGIVLNSLVLALNACDSGLGEQSTHYMEEIISLAILCKKYRPLGTMYMMLCLSTAWVVASDRAKQEQIMSLLSEYGKGLAGCDPTTLKQGLDWLKQRLSLNETHAYEQVGKLSN